MTLQLRNVWSGLLRPGLLGILIACGCSARAEIVLSNYTTAHQLKVMAIGDSITDDCSINGAWRQYMQPLLGTNGYWFNFVGRQLSTSFGQFTKVHHEGYCGSVIAAPGMMDTPVHGYAGTNVYLLKIIADALTNAASRPDLVLLVMGANDIGRGRNPYAVATNDMPQLLDLILSNAPEANIILTKTTTLSNAVAGYATNAANVPLYNASVQQMVNARRAAGQNVFLADMFSAVDYGTMFQTDHLHPNLTGLGAMALEFYSRIQAITLRSDRACTTLIGGGAVWKFSDTGQDLGTNWVRNDYDDSTWNQGPARLGYGDSVAATTLSYGADPAHRTPTLYFRRTFVVPDNGAYTNLNFRMTRVDGAVVWLNGQELFRTNLPAGPIAFTNLALAPMKGESAYIFYPTNLAVAPLPPGTNLLAVELHAATATNDTIGFDLELLGAGYVVPPPALSVAMTPGGISIQWPATNRVPYTLYASTNLAAVNGWTVAGYPVQTNNGQCLVQVPIENGPQLFRLRKE